MPFHEDHENIMSKGKDPKHRNATLTFFSKKALAIQGDDRPFLKIFTCESRLKLPLKEIHLTIDF